MVTILKTETILCSETLITTYKTAQRHNPRLLRLMNECDFTQVMSTWVSDCKTLSLFQEISLDVFMNVYWEDVRVFIDNDVNISDEYVEITWEDRHKIWIPDLYIRQLRDMKVLSLFQEMTSIRLYRNNTFRVSIG